jgi:hypothetical protein
MNRALSILISSICHKYPSRPVENIYLSLLTVQRGGSKHLKESLLRYHQLYNHHIAQKLLGHITPIQAMKNWQETHPNLFKKSAYNLTGPGR